MSAEQCIKQQEEKVAKLNTLRLVDAASISCLSSYPLNFIYILNIYIHPYQTGLAKGADDNMSVLLSHIHMYCLHFFFVQEEDSCMTLTLLSELATHQLIRWTT